MPEIQPLSSTSSTWSLADTGEHMGENAEPDTGPPGPGTQGGSELMPRDLPAGDTPTNGSESRGMQVGDESIIRGPSAGGTQVDGSEPHGMQDGSKSLPRDPSTVAIQAEGQGLQSQPNHPSEEPAAQNGSSPPRIEGKPSTSKRAIWKLKKLINSESMFRHFKSVEMVYIRLEELFYRKT